MLDKLDVDNLDVDQLDALDDADPTEADALGEDDGDNLDCDDVPEVHLRRRVVGEDDEADEPDPPAPPFAVSYPPGSPGKVAALEARAAAGVGLWHPGDTPMDPESHAMGSVGRQAGLRHGYGRRMNPRDVDGYDGDGGLE